MSGKTLVHLIVNPVAGNRTAQEFVKTNVEPLLQAAGYTIKSYETRSEGDAARIAREIGSESSSDGAKGSDEDHTVILAGGDGTAHEFIEGVYSLRGSGKSEARWNLVILPLGTANALYASRYPPGTPSPTLPNTETQLSESVLPLLRSLAAFLNPSTSPTRLPISTLLLLGPDTSSFSPPALITSHVVISTCLHANLLATAESLRTEYPGVERFKVAAQENAGKFFSAKVELRSTSESPVQVYDPQTSTFTPVNSDVSGDGPDRTVILEDDFAYFLSSATCPRLEPTFVISPLLAHIPSQSSMDITILRPNRDPNVKAVLSKAGYGSVKEARAAGDEAVLKAASDAWVPRAWEVLGKAYEEGAHVDLTFTPNGKVESKGSGERVAEVYRCGGFQWTPSDPKDRDSHLVCADGSLIHLPPGGSARVQLEGEGQERDSESRGIHLYA